MIPAELRIAGPRTTVTIRPATVLAPMAGLTDTIFRRFIRRLGGCGLIMTEFTSSDGLTREWSLPPNRQRRSFRYLHFEPEEHPITAQLFGSDPARLADAARIVEEMGFDIVDLNLGCPAKKVVKCNGGSGLLRDLPLVGKIMRAVRGAVGIPFTVKYRAGWSDEEMVVVELARMAEDYGLDAVALHPRTRLQGFAGHADWGQIARVKDAVRIPVIGNGDIQTPADAFRMVGETGCDGIMVGRAAATNPWIFRQIAQAQAGLDSCQPTETDRYEMIREYYGMLIDEGCADAAGKMKQFAGYFTHGVQNGAQLRRLVHDSRSAAEIVEAVDRFFAGAAVSA